MNLMNKIKKEENIFNLNNKEETFIKNPNLK